MRADSDELIASSRGLVDEVATFLRLVGERCKTCLTRNCAYCYSPRARILHDQLVERIGARRSLEQESEEYIVNQIRRSRTGYVRAGKLYAPGLAGWRKRLLLDSMIARGILVRTLRKMYGRTQNYYALRNTAEKTSKRTK